MDDLIRRADAIEICRKWRDKAHEAKDQDGWWMADNLLRRTKEIPSADAVSKWIPYEERLPKESGDYLVWMKYGMNAPTYWIESYDADEKAFGEWFDIDLFDNGMRHEFMVLQNIYAWMPLPKPYEEVKENE